MITKQTILKLRRDKQPQKVSSKIFSHFIEYMYDCINEGMYAQLLKSRGFEYPDNNKDGISDPWFGVWKNDSHAYAINRREAMAPSYAQEIRIYNHYGGYSGIAQNHIRMEKNKEYEGYIWLKSDREVTVEILMRCTNQTADYRKQLTVKPRKWKKYDFQFVSQQDGEWQLEFQLCSEGTLWLDQASLLQKSLPCNIWEEVMERIRELRPPLIRYPGGCFADCYHWMDGIGDKDLRPARENMHWGGIEENNFGTDEFLDFCTYLSCEPMICVNMGSGTPEEAAAWVEYCNGSSETTYGAMRAANGHPQPYSVQYWDIGNEMFADWEIGHCSVEDYIQRYLDFYEKMKKSDPSIRIIACGGDGNQLNQEWNRVLIRQLGDKMDFLGIHMYAPMMELENGNNEDIYYAIVGGAPEKYNKIIQLVGKLIEESQKKIKIGITEWNASYHNNSLREHTLEAGIFAAGMIHMFIRNSDRIELCNISDLINGWPGGLIRSRNGKTFGTPVYYAMKMYTECKIDSLLESNYVCETYTSEACGNIESWKDIPYVDMIICKDIRGEIIIGAVNRHLHAAIGVKLPWVPENTEIMIHTLHSDKTSDCNTMEQEAIRPELKCCRAGEIRLLQHSVNVLTIPAAAVKKGGE